MAFKHKLISEILNDENNKNLVHIGGKYLPHKLVGNEPTGLPQLHQFMDEICTAIRGTKFAYKAALERWVYMQGEPYPMGYIAFGDYRQTTTGDAKFIVCSRKIENVKYAAYSAPYNMRMNGKLETAVRNAKKFLLNYSPIEMAEVDRATVRSAINETRELVAKEASACARKIGLSIDLGGEAQGTLLNELRHLLNTDYEFVDVGYGAKLHTMFESMKELDAQNKQVNMHFVRGYERRGKQSFDVVPVDDVNSFRGTVREEIARYTDELPEDIKGKIAVISMMADASYVDGVGYRVNESMFYVVR
jgi:hypothetical protein